MPDARTIERVRQSVGWVKVDDDSMGDNLAIALLTYFERHPDCPDDDPKDDYDHGWGTWVTERTEEVLARITKAAIEAYEDPAHNPFRTPPKESTP